MSSLAVKVESSSVVPKSLQQIGPAVCRWLVDLPRDVYVNADELARLIGRKSKRTVERMWRRGELPFPVKFAGRNVWLIGAILDFFQTRQAAALKVGGKAGK